MTLSHFLNQSSLSACFAQKASGFSMDSLYILSYSALLLIKDFSLTFGGTGNNCSPKSLVSSAM